MYIERKEVCNVEENKKYEKPTVLTYSEHEIIKESVKLFIGYQ